MSAFDIKHEAPLQSQPKVPSTCDRRCLNARHAKDVTHVPSTSVLHLTSAPSLCGMQLHIEAGMYLSISSHSDLPPKAVVRGTNARKRTVGKETILELILIATDSCNWVLLRR